MVNKIQIPQLDQSIDSLTIVNWHVQEGDFIKKGDLLFDLETNKMVVEYESPEEGVLLKIVIEAGQEVPVLSTAAFIGDKGEKIPAVKDLSKPEKQSSINKSERVNKKSSNNTFKDLKIPLSPPSNILGTTENISDSKVFRISPRAKLFAKDFLIDVTKISGTGGGTGRITESDIKKYLETSGYNKKKISPAAFVLAKKENLFLLDINDNGRSSRITLKNVKEAIAEKPQKFSNIRRTISDRLTLSKQQTPHFYVTISVDMENLIEYRKKLKLKDEVYSINVFIIKAAAENLKKFPELNAWTDGSIYSLKSAINIGIAVSLDDGLVVPVIHNADIKELDELQAESIELVQKAKDKKLLSEEMSGGTFTISNMGMLNVENFSAIINPGESAILAVSSVIPSAIVINNEIVVRNIMKITLSADHRIVDGYKAAVFLNALKQSLENISAQERCYEK